MQKQPKIVIGLVFAALLAGCGTTTVTKTTTVRTTLSATGDQRIFGHIASMQLKGGRYELRFDPSLLVGGVTANVAQAEDQGAVCKPQACPPVANDNYLIDEGHRLLVFVVPTTAHGTVLAKGGTNGFLGKPVGARTLADLVAGRHPLELYEPLSTGVWLLVHSDTVLTFAQQYHP